MSVICGVCKRAPRVGEGMKRVRLVEADMEGMKYPADRQPGLYSCCGECHGDYLPVIAARLGKKPEEMAQNDTV